MKKSLRYKALPVNPSLEHLRKQAKKILKGNSALNLATAQRRVAKEYGFRNWAELSQEVKAIAQGGGSRIDLVAAIRSENVNEAHRLLERWPMLLDPSLWPVAMYQAASPSVTRFLLARGLDPNRSSSPRKPLHFAVHQGWPDIVDELLKNGADPNIRDGDGFTPLDLYGGLVSNNLEARSKIIKILIGAGAEVSVWTAIRIGNTKQALALLVEKPDLVFEKSPDLGFLPLHVASRMANGPVVRWLLDHEADVNGTNPTENSALWFVCQSGADDEARLNVARMLISAGADINRACENGSTALCYAAWRGPRAMVELLVANGARIGTSDGEGKLPVDYATSSNVSRDKDDIIDLLNGTSNTLFR